MTKKPSPRSKGSKLRWLGRFLGKALILVLAGFGLFVSTLHLNAVFHLYTGEIPAALADYWPTPTGSHAFTDACLAFWQELRYVLPYASALVAAFVAGAAVRKSETIMQIMSDFKASRGPIYALSDTITQTQKTVADLSESLHRVEALGPTVQTMGEKIEEAVKQIAELQRFTVSEGAGTGPSPSDGNSSMSATATGPNENWERLRELWSANGARLDAVRARVKDKRRRNRLLELPRTNIINALFEEKLISEAVRNASLQLHTTFMGRYRSRNSIVPDAVIGAMKVLDAQLQKELAVEKMAEEPAAA